MPTNRSTRPKTRPRRAAKQTTATATGRGRGAAAPRRKKKPRKPQGGGAGGGGGARGLARYSVLKGRAVEGRVFSQNPRNPPHFHVTVDAAGRRFDVAVNVQSQDGSEVLYLVAHDFAPPSATGLRDLADGLTRLAGTRSAPHPLALDYVRSRSRGARLVTRELMHPLPLSRGATSRHNDLHNEIEDLVERAVADPTAVLYAFGDAFPDGSGIHDIHMNQGNPRGSHDRDNGIFQDGALVVHVPSQSRYLAVFVAFQTQSWATDERGDPLEPPGGASAPAEPLAWPARRRRAGSSR